MSRTDVVTHTMQLYSTCSVYILVYMHLKSAGMNCERSLSVAVTA